MYDLLPLHSFSIFEYIFYIIFHANIDSAEIFLFRAGSYSCVLETEKENFEDAIIMHPLHSFHVTVFRSYFWIFISTNENGGLKSRVFFFKSKSYFGSLI